MFRINMLGYSRFIFLENFLGTIESVLRIVRDSVEIFEVDNWSQTIKSIVY